MTNTATLTAPESVEAFIARKSSPKWKAPRVKFQSPGWRPIRRLKPEALAALMAEQGASGAFE